MRVTVNWYQNWNESESYCTHNYEKNCKDYVLVITCLGGRLGINCSGAFLKSRG